jgi:hypothetical protein
MFSGLGSCLCPWRQQNGQRVYKIGRWREEGSRAALERVDTTDSQFPAGLDRSLVEPSVRLGVDDIGRRAGRSKVSDSEPIDRGSARKGPSPIPPSNMTISLPYRSSRHRRWGEMLWRPREPRDPPCRAEHLLGNIEPLRFLLAAAPASQSTWRHMRRGAREASDGSARSDKACG